MEMKDFTEISVQSRDALGSSSSTKLRRDQRLPAVIYSAGSDAISISVDTREFSNAARGAKLATIFKFKSDDSELNGQIAFVKEIQKEPIKDRLLHIDFLKIKEGESVNVKIPVTVSGDPIAIREGRAKKSQSTYELEVSCLPSIIPDSVDVDITSLEAGESIISKDVKLPDGVSLVSSGNQTIVTLKTPSAQKEEEVAVEASADGETAETAAETAPAAEDKKEESK